MAKFSPYMAVGETRVDEVAWTEGFWADAADRCRRSMIPAMWKILSDDSLSHAFANFRIAAGLGEGVHRGPPFFDGDLYKWLEAVASTFASSKDPGLDALMDDVVAVVVKAQRDDGYLHTPVIIAERNRARAAVREPGVPGGGVSADRDGETRANVPAPSAPAAMADRLHFEVYNFGHLMTTACRHFEATGKRSLLDAAIRAADYLIRRFAVPDPGTAKNNICPSHYMGLVELHRVTGLARFRDFAAALVDSRNLIRDGTDDNQDRIPFRDQRAAVGHAVRANYLYAGVADIYGETGDATLLPALESILDDVVRTKTYVTGATGALYDGVSPDGAEDHWSIQRVHQAYGRRYQLPNTTAYNETCATIGNVLWNWRMFRISADPLRIDTIETALYNGVLSGISVDGTRYFYQNTLREERVMPAPLRWPRHRAGYLSSFCCPPNTVRTIAGSAVWAYGITSRGISVNLYGGSRLDTRLAEGGEVVLRQSSAYPRDGIVEILVERAPGTEFSISLRIPAWASGASLRVEPADTPERPESGTPATGGGHPFGHAGATEPAACSPGTFGELRRTWREGDRIRLELPMRPRLVVAHPLVEECRNQAAVLRGPLVYCLESADLPRGVGIGDVLLPSDAVFSEETGEGPLAGLAILSCTGSLLRTGPGDALYRSLPGVSPEPVALRFVPYFAWDNRDPGEMTVWLPLLWR